MCSGRQSHRSKEVRSSVAWVASVDKLRVLETSSETFRNGSRRRTLMKQSWSMHRWICVGVRFVSVLGGVGLLAAPVAAQGGAEAGRQVTFTKDVAPILQ